MTKATLNKILSILLIATIVAVIGVVIYLALDPNNRERFTEFYILDETGSTNAYPEELAVGEEGSILLGIVNHEGKTTEYSVRITINSEFEKEIESITLNRDEIWQNLISFAPDAVGENQIIEFLLFRYTETEPYITLRLLLDVF